MVPKCPTLPANWAAPTSGHAKITSARRRDPKASSHDCLAMIGFRITVGKKGRPFSSRDLRTASHKWVTAHIIDGDGVSGGPVIPLRSS